MDKPDQFIIATSTLEWRNDMPGPFVNVLLLLHDDNGAWVGQGYHDAVRWCIYGNEFENGGCMERDLRDSERVLAHAFPATPDLASFLEAL